MAREIHPLTETDLPELRQFLIAGFHAESDPDFAALEVLRWKYLEPLESTAATDSEHNHHEDLTLGTDVDGLCNAPLSYIARDDTGPIIGHLGLCRTVFEGARLTTQGGVKTIHIIDWLGAPGYRSIGMSLMRHAHQSAPTQFGLGVSEAALLVGERAGYRLRNFVPVYNRPLRSGYWLRTRRLGPLKRGLKLVPDALRHFAQPDAHARIAINLKQTRTFGIEITPIIEKAKFHVILTRRDAARLNAFLRFPRQAISGWHVVDADGQLRGFALLNLIPKDHGHTRIGKIVDCLLDNIEPDFWHAVVLALTQELMRQGADVAQAYASTPWTASALRQSGYTTRFTVKFHIRDRLGLIPHNDTFHLTPLEGDYAYT
jgi:hypothetical protein